MMVLINKSKGDTNSPASYMSLCLLKTAGKVLEKLIKPRLKQAITTLEIYPTDSMVFGRAGL